MNSAVGKRTQWHLSLALAALVVANSGCATGPDPRRLRLPPPPSEELRSQFGRLRLSEGNTPTEALLAGPTRGAGEGAARGALTGVALTPRSSSCELCFFLIPPAALVGGVVGAARAESAAELDTKAKALKVTMEELKVPETFRRCVGDRLQEFTSTPGNRVVFQEPASTILEVVVEQFGLIGATGPINPPLSIILTERTRLIRASDGAELYGHWLTYRGRPRPFEDWFVQNSINSKLLYEEADRACRELAERLVDEVFLLYLPGAK